MTAGRARFDQRLAQLGPDILAPELDEERFLRRLRDDDPTRPIGDAVLDQRTIAGIGNLWKVEGCFAAGIDPWRPAGEVSDAEALAIVRECRPRMQRSALDGNQTRFKRIYGKAGLPCPRCGPPALIAVARPVGRQPADLLVPAVPDLSLRRVGHKGADHIAPGNTPASFDAALAADVHMIEFDVLPEDPDAPATTRLAARARLRARRPGRRRARGGARAPRRARLRRRGARRRPQAPRLRGARGRGAARVRAGGAHARLHAVHAQPRQAARARAAAAARLVGAARAARLRRALVHGGTGLRARAARAPPAARGSPPRISRPGAATR